MPIGIDDAALAAAAGAAEGGVSMIGQFIAGNQNRAASGKQMRWQDANIRKQMDWTERMSNTAYQRAVADMKKAGLNPALMYKGMSPESTPSSAGLGSSQTHSFHNPLSGFRGVSSALDLLRTKAEIENVNSLTKKNVVDARSTAATLPKKELTAEIYDDVKNSLHSAKSYVKSVSSKIKSANARSSHSSKSLWDKFLEPIN